jgi:hypothetical protein
VKVIRLTEVPLDRVDYGDLSDIDPKDLPTVDPIEEPIFRFIEKGKPLTLVMGRRLVAAAVRMNQRAIMAKVVECQEHELERLQLVDKAFEARHRKDKDAWYGAIAKLVDLYQPEAEYMPWTPQAFDNMVGRPVTARGRARLMAADALGIKLPTIYKAESFVKKGATSQRKAPGFEHYGLLTGSPALATFANIELRSHLAATRCNEALKELTKLEREADGLYPPGVLRRIRDSLELAGSIIRKHSPRGICAWCKGLPGAQEKCGKCYHLGWIGSIEVPSELQNATVAMVGDELRSVAQVLAEHEESKSLEVTR